MKFVQAYGAMFGCDKKKEYVNYPNYDECKSNRGENSLSWSISKQSDKCKGQEAGSYTKQERRQAIHQNRKSY